MRVEKTYYAFDDEEFYDEESCLAYEQGILGKFGSAQFFDDECKPVDVAKNGAGDVYFIRIKDKENAPALFSWLNGYCGFEYPTDEYENEDLFVYDCNHDEWVNLNDQLRWAQKMLAEFDSKEGENDS